MAEPMKLTVISDYICPWCYIASKRVARLEVEFDLAVNWWPFELHPETPREGRDVAEVISPGRQNQAYRDHLKAYAAEAGITLASNRRVANSHLALELAEFARDQGKFAAVREALFRAYFEEGRDIGRVAILLVIAAEHGLPPEETAAALESGHYRPLVDRTTALAREKGFTSTPAIIFNDSAVITGAQDYNVYESVLIRLGARSIRSA